MLGSVFLGIKAYEYCAQVPRAPRPGAVLPLATGTEADTAEIFFSLYFALTGLHALHMIIGLGIMAWLFWLAWSRSRRPRLPHARSRSSGLYWHFVDIVWIFLFPLLYLIGRH